MFVIDVVPFARAVPTGSLSYRSRTHFSVGSLVSVPLRKQVVTGIVIECVPVRDVKAMLKAAPFVLRSGAPKLIGKIPASYRAAAAYIAEYHAVSLGSVFRAILPEILIAKEFPKRFTVGTDATTTFVEAPYINRLREYKKYISRAGGKSSILIIAPTAVEVARLAHTIENAIVITGEQTSVRRAKAIEQAVDADVIVTTPYYAFTPIKRLAHIIIERESAGSYLDIRAPHLDRRIAIRALAAERNIQLTYGDYPLRLEVRKAPEAPLVETLHTQIELVDTRAKDKPAARAVFSAVPKPLLRELANVVSKGGRAVVLSARKGYAPAVVCRNCGTTVRDAYGRALSLATVHGKRALRSADGSVLRDARALCDECGGWDLVPLGIGVERVVEEIANALPEVNIVRFDADTVKSRAAARSTAALFNKPSTIIIGTESLIHWLDPATPISLAIIASADTLLALPFWRARERFVRLALSLAERSERLIVATRRLKDVACSALTEAGAAPFFKEEAALRTKFHYPPYGHLLIIRISGENVRLDADEARIRRIITPLEPIRLPDRQTIVRKHTSTLRTLVMKIMHNAWPSLALSEALAALPPHISISIDSESLW